MAGLSALPASSHTGPRETASAKSLDTLPEGGLAGEEINTASGEAAFVEPVAVELSGGLELLFDGEKEIMVPYSVLSACAPSDSIATMASLIEVLTRDYLCERPELFVDGDTIRPGILCLINDADWELEGQLEYALEPGDTVAFVSTLHGG